MRKLILMQAIFLGLLFKPCSLLEVEDQKKIFQNEAIESEAQNIADNFGIRPIRSSKGHLLMSEEEMDHMMMMMFRNAIMQVKMDESVLDIQDGSSRTQTSSGIRQQQAVTRPPQSNRVQNQKLPLQTASFRAPKTQQSPQSFQYYDDYYDYENEDYSQPQQLNQGSLQLGQPQNNIQQQQLSVQQQLSIQQQKEQERQRQLETQREQERQQQLAVQRDREQQRQLEAQREQERLRQLEAQRERERQRQFEAQREQERLRQLEARREQERLQQLEAQREQERLRQLEAQRLEEDRRLAEQEQRQRFQQDERRPKTNFGVLIQPEVQNLQHQFPQAQLTPPLTAQPAQPIQPTQPVQPAHPQIKELPRSRHQNNFGRQDRFQVASQDARGPPPEPVIAVANVKAPKKATSGGRRTQNEISTSHRNGKSFSSLSPGIPETNFSCASQQYPGLYADIEADCQVFHMCQANGRSNAFLCPEGTAFDQRHLVCNWKSKVKCEDAPTFYEINKDIYT